MRKQFVRVTLDSVTYGRLTKLAFANQMSRAEYIRQFVSNQFNQLKPAEGKILLNERSPEVASIGAKAVIIPSEDTVVTYDEDGRPITFGQLDPRKQAITVIANALHIPIDVDRWKRQLLGKDEPEQISDMA